MTPSLRADLARQRPAAPIALDPPLPVAEVPTPALLLDEAALDRNLARMSAHLAAHNKGLRPHAKTHKCPLIAHRQIAHGALGVCAAKVSEALVLRAAGVERVLITSPVTDRARAELVADLARAGPGIQLVVDSARGIECLERALTKTDEPLEVLIDLDPHMGRTGVRDGDDVLRLADRIALSPVLDLSGVQHYCGHIMHVMGHATRRAQSIEHWQRAFAIVDRLRQQGHRVEVVTGGGTGTYDIDSELAPITDLQVGSYVFMDEQYRVIGGRGGPVLDDFEVSLTVMTTAISQPARGAITIDCGFKGFASESIAPVAPEFVGATYRFAGDEHGVLILAPGAQSPILGDRVQFVTPHCDPTVNLYDHYWVHRGGLVHALWPITGRGCSW
jgi:D-serine deaminase-like pyridoxal phosphate-dependent protein